MGVGLTPAGIDGFVEYGPVFDTLNKLSAVLSIIGCLVVICTFLAFRQLRRFFSRLVVYLAISDLWLCTSLLMGQSKAPHYTKCLVQSTFGTFFGLASILWTVAIADSVRRTLLQRDLSLESKHESRLHMFAWGVPLIAVVISVSTGVSGPAGLMCWIRNTAAGTVVRMVTFYIPLWLGVGYCLWVYWEVTRMMGRLLEQHQIDGSHEYESSVWEYQQDLDRQRRSLRSLLLLPAILMFCWTPSSIRRVVDVFVPGWAWTPLDYLCVFAGPLQGALNAVMYGLTPAVRDAVFGRLDHSAQKLRGVQRRLKALRPGRGRKQRQAFQRLQEDGHTPVGRKLSLDDATPLEELVARAAAPAAEASGPSPSTVGRGLEDAPGGSYGRFYGAGSKNGDGRPQYEGFGANGNSNGGLGGAQGSPLQLPVAQQSSRPGDREMDGAFSIGSGSSDGDLELEGANGYHDEFLHDGDQHDRPAPAMKNNSASRDDGG